MAFRLSATLIGHEEDVKGLAFPQRNLIISCARDATVRQWRLVSSNPPLYDNEVTEHRMRVVKRDELKGPEKCYVNSLLYIPPSSLYSEGLIASGADDKNIEIRPSSGTLNDEAMKILEHTERVNSLDMTDDGQLLVSGSNDCTAKIWNIGKWNLRQTLHHEGMLWAVLAFGSSRLITAGVDGFIRIFNIKGNLLNQFKGSKVVLRCLCKLPPDHPSGAHFASAAFDGIIRLWTLDGNMRAELRGHSGAIYSIAALPDGQIVSGSQDGTMKIWKYDTCVQTIQHPSDAVEVVAVCLESGDIATGTNDGVIRIFTKSKEREVDAEAMKSFTETAKAFAVSAAKNKPERRKMMHEGKEYDYVFTIDLPGGAKQTLTYNISEGPEAAATRFLDSSSIGKNSDLNYSEFHKELVSLLRENTSDASSGTRSDGVGRATWGGSQPNMPPSQTRVVPRTTHLPPIAFAGSKSKIQSKIIEFNKFLVQSGAENISLEAGLTNYISDSQTAENILAATLDKITAPVSASSTEMSLNNSSIDLILHICTKWPRNKKLPGLDLLRIAVAHSPAFIKRASSQSTTLIDLLADADVFAPDTPINNVMMATRALANLSNTSDGRTILEESFTKINSLLGPFFSSTGTNANLGAALATVYLNYAVLFRTRNDPEVALNIVEVLSQIISVLLPEINGEDTFKQALYRGTVALGTVLAFSINEIKRAAVEVFEVDSILRRMDGEGGEDLQNVKDEVLMLLQDS